MGDIADLVGLVYVLIARNGAKRKLTARICADVDRKRGMGQQDCCPIIVKPMIIVKSENKFTLVARRGWATQPLRFPCVQIITDFTIIGHSQTV